MHGQQDLKAHYKYPIIFVSNLYSVYEIIGINNDHPGNYGISFVVSTRNYCHPNCIVISQLATSATHSIRPAPTRYPLPRRTRCLGIHQNHSAPLSLGISTEIASKIRCSSLGDKRPESSSQQHFPSSQRRSACPLHNDPELCLGIMKTAYAAKRAAQTC